jgi:DNA polymerase I-like protein with 3'-5' exonuclease and polymerase domains
MNSVVTRNPDRFKLLGVEHISDRIPLLGNTLAVDTETTGLEFTEDVVYSVQVGDGNNYIFDVQSVEFSEVVSAIEGKRLILHNAKFDLPFLMKKGFFPPARLITDTFIQEKCLTLGKYVPLDYGYVVNKYAGVKLDKSVQSTIRHGFRHIRDIEYAWNDTKYLHKVAQSQWESAKREHQELDLSINNAFSVVLAYIEFCGIGLDRKAWLEKMSHDMKLRLEALQALNTYCKAQSMALSNQVDLFTSECEVGINWKSSPQVKEFFKGLGLDLNYKGKETVAKDVVKKYAKDFEVVRLYVAYKNTEKDCTTYGEKFLKAISPATGRIHTQFNQLVSTGRMSCGRKAKEKNGIDKPNLQNVPKGGSARKCFVPKEGNVFVVADYASQESRILADKTKDPALLRFFAEGGGDMHSYVARMLWKEELGHLTLEEVKDQYPDKRQTSKSVNFAIAYGGTGLTIAENAGVSVEEGEEVYNKFMAAFPGVGKFFEVNLKKTLINGYISINEKTGSRTFPLWKPYDENDIDIEEEEDTFRKGMVPAVQFLKELALEVESESFEKEYRLHSRQKTDLFYSELKPKKREYDRLKASLNRLSTNYLIQGTAALQTKLAGILIYEEFRKRGWLGTVKIVNVVHDEYVVECPAHMGEEIKQVVVEKMAEGGNYFMDEVVMYAEAKIADHWIK